MEIKGIRESDKELQLIEECGELIQAMAKYQRVVIGRSATPTTYDVAVEKVEEEFGDVLCVLMSIYGDSVNAWLKPRVSTKDTTEEWLAHAVLKLTDLINLANASRRELLITEDEEPSAMQIDCTAAMTTVASVADFMQEAGLSLMMSRLTMKNKLARWKRRQEVED